MTVFKRCVVSVALAYATVGIAGTTFFVSPSGNDAWTGRLATPNAERTDGPFASPTAAKNAIRKAKAGDMGEPFTVELRGGTYAQIVPLALTPEDSGTAQSPSVWRAYGSERPVISGGRVIEGLRESTVDGVRCWTVTLPEVKSGDWTFRQLFISRSGAAFERRYRPHVGMKAVAGLTYSSRRKAIRHRAAQIDFIFFPGDFQNWENLADVEVVALHTWSSSRLFIEKVDMEKSIVTFTGRPTFTIEQVGPHAPYYIENVKEALGRPGEWYLDRPTGLLTYLPHDGEALGDCRLVAPFLDRVLTFEGDYQNGQFVDYVQFENITFSHNESPLPRKGYGGSQGQPDLPAAIEMTGARYCSFSRCTIAQTGNYGIGIGLGCHGNRVEGCRLYDLGGGGVKVGSIRMKSTADASTVPTGNVIENCAISDGGLMYYSTNAVWAGIVRDTVIAHNEIWNFPYSGVAVGWSWSDKPTSCGGNRIEYNHIHNVVDLLADGASIYTLGRQPGTIIRGNVLHDNVRNRFARHYWQLGLYLDEGSSEMLVENNLSYRVGTHGFNMNGGAENLIQNNISGPVYGSSDAPYIRSHKKPYAKNNVFTHNIAYCDSDNLADRAWETSLFLCKENVYWNMAGKPLMFAGKTFSEWQATGQDVGSIEADPLFESPDSGDYRLKPDSPALAVGFKPFGPGEAGLASEFRNVAVPVKVTRPPVYDMAEPVVPKLRPGFAADLEEVPVGEILREFRLAGPQNSEAGARVTEEVAKASRRSLELVDRKGLSKSFYPYLNHRLAEPVASGKVVFACDVLQKADSPCPLCVEFRDTKSQAGKKEFVGGPTVRIDSRGTVDAADQDIVTIPPGTWAHLEMALTMGNKAAHTAALTISLADGTKHQATIPLSDEFQIVTHLYLICDGDIDGTCYLDNLSLRINGFPPIPGH